MPQDRRWERRRPMRPGLFAARQVYVRSGASSRYVNLSRALQIRVATAMAIGVLWSALATYAAVVKHLETIEQGRELTRLESVAQNLRTTVEDARDPRSGAPDKAAGDLEAELAAARAGRERALTLAGAAAAEAAELRREVALANERVSELTAALAQAQAGQPPILDRIASLAADAARADAAAAEPTPEQPGCPVD